MLDLASELDYADPFAPVFWGDEVIERAVRVRRNRRLALIGAAAAGVLAVLAIFGATGWWDGPENDTANRYGTNLADPVPGEHVATDPVVMVASSGGWQMFVFYSTTGALCIGAVELTGRNRGYVVSGLSSALQRGGVWADRPDLLSAGGQDAIAIGFVEGPARSVRVDDGGHTYSAPVVPVHVHGLTDLGAYALRLPQNTGVTGVMAVRPDGSVLASA